MNENKVLAGQSCGGQIWVYTGWTYYWFMKVRYSSDHQESDGYGLEFLLCGYVVGFLSRANFSESNGLMLKVILLSTCGIKPYCSYLNSDTCVAVGSGHLGTLVLYFCDAVQLWNQVIIHADIYALYLYLEVSNKEIG